jgi:Icc protein
VEELIYRLVHISDTHISLYGQFLEKTFDKAIREIGKLDPPADVVVHSGDLTDHGVQADYEYAKKKIGAIEGKLLVAPGNHDERNYGQSIFWEMISPMDYEEKVGNAAFFLLNSPEPDRDAGRLGRRRQRFLAEGLSRLPSDAIKVVVFHHHLVPVPYAGREMNVLEDAGMFLTSS